jgi:archaellum component FlaC
MKTNILAVTFMVVTVFAIGCKPAAEKSPNDKPLSEGMAATEQQLEKVAKETKEAAKEINDYAYAQRVEFAEKMKTQLNDIKKELDLLAAKLENANEAVKTEGKLKVQALRDQVAALDKQLDGIKDANESTWDEVKTGFRKSYDEVKDSFQQARQWLSDKIAP